MFLKVNFEKKMATFVVVVLLLLLLLLLLLAVVAVPILVSLVETTNVEATELLQLRSCSWISLQPRNKIIFH